MKTTLKRSLIAGSALATLGLAAAGVGAANAATSTTGSSLVDKIATTFNLNKDDVAKVFAEDRAAHEAEMKAAQEQWLAQAVTDGKLTQAQADHIKQTQAEIEALHAGTEPGQEDDTTRENIRTKIDSLRTWAQQNNIDLQYLGHGGHGGPGFPPADAPAPTN